MKKKYFILTLYEQNEEDILRPTKEYFKKMDEYVETRQQFEKELNLNSVEVELLEKVCDSIFELDEVLLKQSFVRGFKIARDLLS
jgi:hypothetical protein